MNTKKPLRVMFAGASGTGKTTLAKYVSDYIGDEYRPIPFVSGSVSDLLPNTREMTHADMLSRDPQTLVMEDFQILNLRKKLFSEYVENAESFVSDRSFIDLAAYFLYKQADKLPQCEVESFINLCNRCITEQCTHLIVLPFNMAMFNHWITEDNNKRITSRFFQMEISRIMRMVLDIMGYEEEGSIQSIQKGLFNSTHFELGVEYGNLRSPYGYTRVIILNEVNLKNRQTILNYVLNR